MSDKVELRESPTDTKDYLHQVLHSKVLAEYPDFRGTVDDFIQKQLAVGVDYGEADERSSKKTLLQPGAEKFCIAFKLVPAFLNDGETHKMFGSPDKLVCFRCFLIPAESRIKAIKLIGQLGITLASYVMQSFSVGEGRGCGTIDERSNATYNDIVKRTMKRALVNAVNRTFGLSDKFTQDMEEFPELSEGRKLPTKKEGAVEANHTTLKVDDNSDDFLKADEWEDEETMFR